MGNTLGALVFLGAFAFLGWEIYKGRAQSFLSALAHAGGGAGTASPTSPPPPGTVFGGPLQGVPFAPSTQSADPTAPFFTLPNAIPNVFGNAFGENAPVNSPSTESPYGVYSPIEWAGP